MKGYWFINLRFLLKKKINLTSQSREFLLYPIPFCNCGSNRAWFQVSTKNQGFTKKKKTTTTTTTKKQNRETFIKRQQYYM